MTAIKVSLARLAASTQQAWDDWHLEGGRKGDYRIMAGHSLFLPFSGRLNGGSEDFWGFGDEVAGND